MFSSLASGATRRVSGGIDFACPFLLQPSEKKLAEVGEQLSDRRFVAVVMKHLLKLCERRPLRSMDCGGVFACSDQKTRHPPIASLCVHALMLQVG